MAGEHEHTTGSAGQNDLVAMSVEVSALALQIGSAMTARYQAGGSVLGREVDQRHDAGDTSGLIDVGQRQVVGVEFLRPEAGEWAAERRLSDNTGGAENAVYRLDDAWMGENAVDEIRQAVGEIDEAARSGPRFVSGSFVVTDVDQPFQAVLGQRRRVGGRDDVGQVGPAGVVGEHDRVE